MENERKVLVTNFTIGMGFWTSICVFFAGIKGVTSLNLQQKQEEVISHLIRNMNAKISKYAPYYKPIGFELWFNGPLNATLSLTLEKADIPYETKIKMSCNNVGIGLWTATCKMFAGMFGMTSQCFLDKMDSIIERRSLSKEDDKLLVQHLIRKPKTLNIVEAYLYQSEYIEPVETEEPEVTDNEEVKSTTEEKANQITNDSLKTMEPVDKSTLKVGDIVYINHHEYNEMAKKSLNPGDKVIIKEINEDSVIVLVDKQYSSFVAEVRFDNLKR